MPKIEEVGIPKGLLAQTIIELEAFYLMDQCDHSVGICYCDLGRLISRLKDCLKTPVPNPNKEVKL